MVRTGFVKYNIAQQLINEVMKALLIVHLRFLCVAANYYFMP